MIEDDQASNIKSSETGGPGSDAPVPVDGNAAQDAAAETAQGKNERDAGALIDDPSRDGSGASAAGAGQGLSILNDEIEIVPETRLPHLDHGTAKAYAAQARDSGQHNYYALLCDDQSIPRSRVAGKFAGIESPGIVRLVASGVAFWPPSQSEHYFFVFENNLGNPLMTKLKGSEGLGWKNERVMSAFIVPVFNTLVSMRDADLFHGAVNPANIFDGGNKDNSDRVILGECLSGPPGSMQPLICEPIDRAMCSPEGRGRGTIEDDLYAMGVSIAMLMRTKDPMEGMSDEEMLRQKIELGTYTAMLGKDRFTGAILELLRGLLFDEREQRWSVDEVVAWLDGQRLSPRQGARKNKAARPIQFNGEKYLRPRVLAMDLEKNQSEAIQLIDGGAIEQWLDRSLEDKLIINRLETALEHEQNLGRGAGTWDRMLCRVSMALDPPAPIRYKGLHLNPEGFTYAMAMAFQKNEDLRPYIDIINLQLVFYWLDMQVDAKIDSSGLVSKFDGCRAFLRQKNIGYGVERCIYFLCPEVRCLSKKLSGFYVRNPEDFMVALEAISGRADRPDLFIDRHSAAFLSVKDHKMIDAFFLELNAEEYHKKIIGNIKTLATIQKRSRMEPFPGIGGWIADILEPVYERYHDRHLREKLKKNVHKAAKAGDISKIVTVIDNNEVRKKDFAGFKRAMNDYINLTEEKNELEHKLKNPHIFEQETGRDIAAIFTGLLAGILIFAAALYYFTTNTM